MAPIGQVGGKGGHFREHSHFWSQKGILLHVELLRVKIGCLEDIM